MNRRTGLTFNVLLIAVLFSAFGNSFGDNSNPEFAKVEIRFTDRSKKKVYIERDWLDQEVDTPSVVVIGEGRPDQAIYYLEGRYSYNLSSFADTVHSVQLDSTQMFFFAIKKPIKLFNKSLYIGKRKIEKDQHFREITPYTERQDYWNRFSTYWNFVWADENKIKIFQSSPVVFYKVYVDDGIPLQFLAISFSPSITKKQFSIWYKKHGLKSKSIINAQKSGELVIILQSTD